MTVKDSGLEKHIHNKNYEGIMFIGDPHLTYLKVSTRHEQALAFPSLEKLRFALQTARERNLLALCLGDLFNKKKENNIPFMSAVISLFHEFGDMICLVGNHDKSDTHGFTENDVMSVIDATGFVQFVSQPGIIGHVLINGETVLLGGSPHGSDIPTEILSCFETVWVTHHDLNFDPRFSSVTCHPIKGCNTVVNGHLHKTFEPITAGNTTWHNPGNIFRMSRGEKAHIPSVWTWKPRQRELVRIAVPYQENVFLETEDLIHQELDQESKEETRSVFVQTLRSNKDVESLKTDDGTLVGDLIEEAVECLDLSLDVQKLLEALLQDSVTQCEGS